MAKLLMISGDRELAEGKRGAFYNTLEEFHKYWDRIDIICPKAGSPKVKEVFGNVFIHSSPWILVFQAGFIYRKGKEIFEHHKFDLVTVHEYPPFYNGIGARLLWRKIKVPYVLEIHHVPGYPKAGNIKEKIYRRLMGLFIRFDAKRAKAVRVVNQKETPNFLVKAGVPLGKIIFIPSAYVDLSIFKPTDLPKKYDLIFIGRLVENKGINLFVEAVEKIKARAVVVGSGPLAENLKRKIINENLENQITLYGWAKDQNEIAELLNKSKILMMPSYNEGGPRVVVEALACGIPVLATPVGIVPDLLKNGSGGEIIAWDAEDAAKKARELLRDPGRYEKLSNMAVEEAKLFEKQSAIKNYADKLKSLI